MSRNITQCSPTPTLAGIRQCKANKLKSQVIDITSWKFQNPKSNLTFRILLSNTKWLKYIRIIYKIVCNQQNMQKIKLIKNSVTYSKWWNKFNAMWINKKYLKKNNTKDRYFYRKANLPHCHRNKDIWHTFQRQHKFSNYKKMILILRPLPWT